MSILIFISVIGMGGAMGVAFRSFFFGLFGIMAYAFPFWLFFFCVFLAANTYQRDEGYGRLIMKLVAALLLLVALCIFMHLVCYLDDPLTLKQLYAAGADKNNGGGAFGGFFGLGLAHGIGLVGAFLVTIILLAVSVVLITEHSFFISLSKKFENPQVQALRRERRELAAMERQERRERELEQRREELRRRQEQKVSGVASSEDITVGEQEPIRKRTGNMSEIRPPRPKRTAQSRPSRKSEMPVEEPVLDEMEEAAPAGGRQVRLINLDTDQVETVTLWKDGLEPNIHMPDEEDEYQPSPKKAKGPTIHMPGDDEGFEDDYEEESLRAPTSSRRRTRRASEDDGEIERPAGGRRSRRTADEDADYMSVGRNPAGRKKSVQDDIWDLDAEPDEELSAEAIMEQEMAKTAAAAQEVTRSRKKNPNSTEEDNEAVRQQIENNQPAPVKKKYIYPKPTLLKKPDPNATGDSRKHLQEMSARLQDTLTL